MLPQEADWIHDILYDTIGRDAFPLLNVGSQTLWFRTVAQPHIDEAIFAPARACGWPVIHVDLQKANGVDMAGDLCDPEFRKTLLDVKPRAILCSNLLEHLPVAIRDTICQAMVALLPPGGYLLVTVPSSFPYHPDPIDTYFRPAAADLARFFPGAHLLKCHELEGETRWAYFRQQPRALAKVALRALLPFYRLRCWAGVMHQFFWLFRPIRIACALLQKA